MDDRTEMINWLFHSNHSGETNKRNLIDFMLGDYIGAGCERRVFEYGLDYRHDYVVKIEQSPRANVLEYEIWQEVKDKPQHSKWFAPVVRLSNCGSFLIMERTRPMSPNEFPAYIPSYMADTHQHNWGLIDNKPVAHDYANNNIFTKGLNNRLVKAKFT